jgi:hypothetical protein
MGHCLEGHSPATNGDVTDGRRLQTTCALTCPQFPASPASLID